MGPTIFGIVVVIAFFSFGVTLILNPNPFLAKLGRPATDKHVRATRLIGTTFLILVLMTLVQWFRSMR
jgi:hypothetical protein